jgi:ABC-2 type transport system permease protein
MNTLGSLIRKETRHILRDRQTLLVLILIPVLMVLLFGFAIRTDVEDVQIVVVDPSGDARSTELTRRIASTNALHLVSVTHRREAVEPMLRSGEANVALILPTQFAQRLQEGRAEVEVVSDGSNANYASSAESYVRAVVNQWTAESGRPPGITISTRMRFNPTLESENLFVPGLLAFVLTLISALMTAISIAREKETGSMEVLLVSPLRPLQIIVGKVFPYIALAFFNAITTLAVAWLVFDVPIQGSLGLLLGASLLYVLVALAIGVVASSLAPDQRTAMMGTLLGLLIPTMTLSGFIFPIASIPDWLYPVTQAVPATWFIIITRGIMLKGIGAALLWKELLVLAGFAVLLLGVAAATFNDRLD